MASNKLLVYSLQDPVRELFHILQNIDNKEEEKSRRQRNNRIKRSPTSQTNNEKARKKKKQQWRVTAKAVKVTLWLKPEAGRRSATRREATRRFVGHGGGGGEGGGACNRQGINTLAAGAPGGARSLEQCNAAPVPPSAPCRPTHHVAPPWRGAMARRRRHSVDDQPTLAARRGLNYHDGHQDYGA